MFVYPQTNIYAFPHQLLSRGEQDTTLALRSPDAPTADTYFFFCTVYTHTDTTHNHTVDHDDEDKGDQDVGLID